MCFSLTALRTECLPAAAQGKGKIAAQCSHATLGQFKKLWRRKDPNLKRWVRCGCLAVCS